MLLFVAQLIHVSCTTIGAVGVGGVGEAKQATFQEIMSSLLPQADGKKKVISVQEPCIYACNTESVCSLYLHFSRAVTFESNVSLALNSLLMWVKAKARYMFWRLGEGVQENPSLTLDGFSFATKNDSRFTLNGSPIHKPSSSVWCGAAWWTVHGTSVQHALWTRWHGRACL